MLDVTVDDAVEPKVMEEDEEYTIRIVSARVTESDKGRFLIPRFEIVDEPYAKEFTMVLRLPDNEMTPKQKNEAKWRLKCFYEAFDFMPRGEYDPGTELPGLEASAILGVSESDEYGEQNYVKRLLVRR